MDIVVGFYLTGQTLTESTGFIELFSVIRQHTAFGCSGFATTSELLSLPDKTNSPHDKLVPASNFQTRSRRPLLWKMLSGLSRLWKITNENFVSRKLCISFLALEVVTPLACLGSNLWQRTFFFHEILSAPLTFLRSTLFTHHDLILTDKHICHDFNLCVHLRFKYTENPWSQDTRKVFLRCF